MRQSNLDAHKHRDWFLALASAMEPINAAQSSFFAKFYLFLRDFLPRGLTGRFAHIHGNDVMRYICSSSEVTRSRHKATKAANAAFEDLAKWMGTAKTWQEALEKAKTAPETQKVHKRRFGKAPGLHSPDGKTAFGVTRPDLC